MKPLLLAVILFFVVSSCSKFDVTVLPKAFHIEANNSVVAFSGRWRTNSTDVFRLSRFNAVNVTCRKDSMTCDEIVALLYEPDDRVKDHSLQVLELSYRVLEWSNSRIRAIYEAPVADFELRVSLTDKTAERTFVETRARGAETANSSIAQHWTLE